MPCKEATTILSNLSILSHTSLKIGPSTFFPNSLISAPAKKVLPGAAITIALIKLFDPSSLILFNNPFRTEALIAFTGGFEISINPISSIIVCLTSVI